MAYYYKTTPKLIVSCLLRTLRYVRKYYLLLNLAYIEKALYGRRISPSDHNNDFSARHSVIRKIFSSAPWFTFVCLLLCAGLSPVHAEVAPDAVGRQNDIIEHLQQDLLRTDQKRARETVAPHVTAEQPGIPKITVPDLGVFCRDIRTIHLNGATLLPVTIRRQLDRDYAGRCLGVNELEAILALITKNYVDRGYITTRAYLPAQDLRTGTLDITVIEGTIERYQINSNRSNAVWVRGAFPAKPDELLNLRDLEQGVDQINRLASNRAHLDIQPGEQPGQSVVVVNNPHVFPINVYSSYDNYGIPATGSHNASVTMNLDSVLGFNEQISVTKRGSIPHSPAHNSQAIAMQVSVPFGYNLLTLDTSRTNYANRLNLTSGSSILSQGETYTYSANLDHVVYRDQVSRAGLSARLTTQETNSYLAGQFLGVASRKLTYLDIGSNAFTVMAGGIFNARLSFIKGLPYMGALADSPSLPTDAPHAQFRKLMLDLGFNRQFSIGKQALLWSSQFSGQYAYDVLYGSQQFLVGGISSVRSSRVNMLSGDNGYLWRNELSIPWHGYAGLSGRVYSAFDIGGVTSRAPGVSQGSMSGIVLGSSIAWRSLNLDVFVAPAVYLPSQFQSEPTQYGLRLSYSL